MPKKPKINGHEMDWLVSKMLENPFALIPRYIPSTVDRTSLQKGVGNKTGAKASRAVKISPILEGKPSIRDPFLLLCLIRIYNPYEGYLRSWRLGDFISNSKLLESSKESSPHA